MHSRHFTGLSLLCATFSLSCLTQAAPVVFTIDPAQSQVTISGNIAGATIQEQGPGSLTTKFGGTIKADVTSSTVQFTGGSAIDAEVNGDWEPGVGGAAGRAPADYGGQAPTVFFTAKGAFRNILLDVTSDPLALSNGSFDASSLVFGFPADSKATLDYDAVLTKGSRALTGLSTNKVTELGTLSTEAGVQKLVIRVDTEFKFRALTANDSTGKLVGQLVATSQSDNRPVLSTLSFVDKKLSFAVENATASTQLQSSTDLTTWQSRTAERKTENNKVVFTAEQNAPIEFFRVVQ